jgi:hypothetical protein
MLSGRSSGASTRQLTWRIDCWIANRMAPTVGELSIISR